jgi:hypothetical protein
MSKYIHYYDKKNQLINGLFKLPIPPSPTEYFNNFVIQNDWYVYKNNLYGNIKIKDSSQAKTYIYLVDNTNGVVTNKYEFVYNPNLSLFYFDYEQKVLAVNQYFVISTENREVGDTIDVNQVVFYKVLY